MYMVSPGTTTQRLSEGEAGRTQVDGSPGIKPVVDIAHGAVGDGRGGPSPLPAALRHDDSEEGDSVRSEASSGIAVRYRCSQPGSPAKFMSLNSTIPGSSQSPNAKRGKGDRLDDFYQYPARQSKAQKQKIFSKLKGGTRA